MTPGKGNIIEIVFKVNLTNVEKEFGFTQNLKFEKSRISNNKNGKALGIDDPLFFSARFEKTSDNDVKVSWPNVSQISFYDCKLQRIRPGAFKGNFSRKKRFHFVFLKALKYIIFKKYLKAWKMWMKFFYAEIHLEHWKRILLCA